MAAYLRPEDQAIIVDEHVQPLTLEDEPDLVIVQVYITNAYRAYRIADHYRSLGAFVCLGGLHVTALPEEAAPHADAIFLGPGEQTFPRFLEDLRRGRPERVYASTTGRTLERVPPIRRDLIRRTSYLVPNSITLVTRGCPQHCDYFATRMLSSRAVVASTRSGWTMLWPKLHACPDVTSTSSTTIYSAIGISAKPSSKA